MGEPNEQTWKPGQDGVIVVRCWSCGEKYAARSIAGKCPPCRGRRVGEEAPLPGLRRSEN